MNPFMSKEMGQAHIGDLRRSARRTRVSEDYRELDGQGSVTVRASKADDFPAVQLLAALEGRHVPSGPILVAEVDDELVAALPLDGGRALADPFRPTGHLVAMLELRARQLHQPARTRLPLLARLRVPRAA